MDLFFIGVDGKERVSSDETREQIARVRNNFECALFNEKKQMTWDDFDHPLDQHCLFQRIIYDKLKRDNNMIVTEMPNCCVISVLEKKVIRLEYYEGLHQLKLMHDYRAPEIQNKKLPNYMKSSFVFNDLSAYLRSIKTMDDLCALTDEQIAILLNTDMSNEEKELVSVLEDEKVKKVMDINFDVIGIIDKDLKYIYGNENFLRFATNSKDKNNLLQTTDYDLFPLETAERMTIADMEVMRTGRMIKREIMLQNKENDVRWFASRRSAIYDRNKKIYAVIFTGWDITERKLQEEKAYEEERKKLPPTTDSVYLIDMEGKVLACNEQGAQRFNMEIQDLIGKNLNNYLQDVITNRGMIDLTVVNMKKVRRFENENNGRHYDNTIYPIVDDEDRVSKLVIFSHDISARLAYKKQLENKEQ